MSPKKLQSLLIFDFWSRTNKNDKTHKAKQVNVFLPIMIQDMTFIDKLYYFFLLLSMLSGLKGLWVYIKQGVRYFSKNDESE